MLSNLSSLGFYVPNTHGWQSITSWEPLNPVTVNTLDLLAQRNKAQVQPILGFQIIGTDQAKKQVEAELNLSWGKAVKYFSLRKTVFK